MQAIVFKDTGKIVVETLDDPQLSQPTDALLRVTSAAMCGSDLHMYGGRTPAEADTVLGHEILGVVEAIGAAVKQLKPGDRVVLPFNVPAGCALIACAA